MNNARIGFAFKVVLVVRCGVQQLLSGQWSNEFIVCVMYVNYCVIRHN